MPVLTEEQTMLRDTAHEWVNDKSPIKAFRRMRDSGSEYGFEPAIWDEIAAMGWAGAAIPEEYGGSGLGYEALGLILEEAGRTLTASPLLASAFCASSALLLGGTDAQKQAWLPGIAEGRLIATLAIDEGPHHAPERTLATVVPRDDGFVLNGRKVAVPEGFAANLLIVAARIGGTTQSDGQVHLFLVKANSPGIKRTRLNLINSRGAANIDFENVVLAPDSQLGGGTVLLEKVLDRSRIAVCAEMLGAATNAFHITLDYLKTRVQFGQLIGAFQALQHRAAQMYVELELARSAVEAALAAIDADGPDLPILTTLAKAKMSDAYHLISNEMVQMHGGMGMTDECDAGLFLKHARSCEAAYGSPAFHRDRYATLKGY